MGTLYENIMSLCEERGIKGGKMCTDIEISKGLLTDLKMGRRSGVSAKTADKIASYFGVSVSYLLGTEKEKKLVANSDGLKPVYLSLAKNMQADGIHPDDIRDMIEILKRRRNDKS